MSQSAKHYETYLFIICNKSNEDNSPKFISNEFDSKLYFNLDGCTFIFEWNTPFACPSCLKKESVYKTVNSFLIQGSCTKGSRIIFYEENDYCLIKNGSNTNLHGWNLTYNEEIDLRNLNDTIVSNYFKIKRILVAEQIFNISQSDNLIYVDSSQMIETCRYYDDIKSDTLIIIICVPLIYFITMFILICVYCKYKKITTQYEKLKDEKEGSNNSKNMKCK